MTENVKHCLDTSVASLDRPSKIPKTQDLTVDDEDGEELQESGVIAQLMSPNPRLQRYLIAVEYIGTRFAGSQKQLNCRTVVGVLEEAFHKFIGQPVSISLSSRTDAGVHALSNVCHVDVERISKRKPGEVLQPHEPSVVRRAVNHFLQKNEGDITVVDVRCVPADFHARYKACERTYFYRLLSGPEPLSTFEKDRAWHVPEELDLVAMQEACKVLVGHHDFSSFRASGCQAKSPIRTLDELSVLEVASTLYFPSTMAGGSYGEIELGFGMRRKHHCYVVTARARSFLYHQVRLLVGVLKSVGTGNRTSSDVERILNAKSVTEASPMAPACGLYLGHVKYDLP
ncbi:tRNA pseudouridine synthase A isoform X2 [Jatropha curcas]|uniref:tRNA pseudouridine synthase A isoform X2 n=1 Tax=Jatropha curcas TaxID=180498 RepID=UPI0005FB03DC|nr:tRNA pseudouridine synthase A isoform X2 [Jatropha curcas]